MGETITATDELWIDHIMQKNAAYDVLVERIRLLREALSVLSEQRVPSARFGATRTPTALYALDALAADDKYEQEKADGETSNTA
jgi:hypothetical protein